MKLREAAGAGKSQRKTRTVTQIPRMGNENLNEPTPSRIAEQILRVVLRLQVPPLASAVPRAKLAHVRAPHWRRSIHYRHLKTTPPFYQRVP